jgi:hypothetical protein
MVDSMSANEPPQGIIVMAPEVFQEMLDRAVERIASRVVAPEDGWLDTKAAAAYAGCSVNALWKAIASREVKFAPQERNTKKFFRRSWIDDWRGQ